MLWVAERNPSSREVRNITGYSDFQLALDYLRLFSSDSTTNVVWAFGPVEPPSSEWISLKESFPVVKGDAEMVDLNAEGMQISNKYLFERALKSELNSELLHGNRLESDARSFFVHTTLLKYVPEEKEASDMVLHKFHTAILCLKTFAIREILSPVYPCRESGESEYVNRYLEVIRTQSCVEILSFMRLEKGSSVCIWVSDTLQVSGDTGMFDASKESTLLDQWRTRLEILTSSASARIAWKRWSEHDAKCRMMQIATSGIAQLHTFEQLVLPSAQFRLELQRLESSMPIHALYLPVEPDSVKPRKADLVVKLVKLTPPSTDRSSLTGLFASYDGKSYKYHVFAFGKQWKDSKVLSNFMWDAACTLISLEPDALRYTLELSANHWISAASEASPASAGPVTKDNLFSALSIKPSVTFSPFLSKQARNQIELRIIHFNTALTFWQQGRLRFTFK